MNEFTKDELFDLKYAIEKIRQPGKDILGFYKLQDKIQSMIDVYCDNHEADEFENHDICKHCDKRFR